MSYKNEPKTRLHEIRLARGMSGAELARRSGVSPPTLSKVELGQRGLTKNTAPPLAHALTVPVSELYAEIGSPIPSDSLAPPAPVAFRPAGASFAVAAPAATSPLHLPRDLPVYGSAEGGPEGSFQPPASDLVVDWIGRPPGLSAMRHAFALICEGTSMEPRFFPGEMLYVHPSRPPMLGDYVVAILSDPAGGDDRGYIKRLIRRTQTEIILQQHNPDKEIVIPRTRLRQLFLVLKPSDLYG